jgi:hypothetical protein
MQAWGAEAEACLLALQPLLDEIFRILPHGPIDEYSQPPDF